MVNAVGSTVNILVETMSLQDGHTFTQFLQALERAEKNSSLYSTGKRTNLVQAIDERNSTTPDKSHEMLQAIAELKGAVESNSKMMEEIKNRPSRDQGPQWPQGDHTRLYRDNPRPPADGPQHF
ncbi:hypothetical protein NSK_006171 [Nannochloropsis salina CCMP1776]|jgi:hypothetical protein|uniref:Uncharacterized protein n=1 Tax=Nannochloropsis salina CCMP1776 TaxID=1027361 RepID=A0A4D9CY37_9STRA|nr:hypothetical protein NSK_006171 [Nannochloropsis salina CCMP1776]|eukprot:TFJ82493.1 hypothetical protein NSK_006171 [Nannochloropsis salina CCMP1776]